jgi:hypothetical protein
MEFRSQPLDSLTSGIYARYNGFNDAGAVYMRQSSYNTPLGKDILRHEWLHGLVDSDIEAGPIIDFIRNRKNNNFDVKSTKDIFKTLEPLILEEFIAFDTGKYSALNFFGKDNNIAGVGPSYAIPEFFDQLRRIKENLNWEKSIAESKERLIKLTKTLPDTNFDLNQTNQAQSAKNFIESLDNKQKQVSLPEGLEFPEIDFESGFDAWGFDKPGIGKKPPPLPPEPPKFKSKSNLEGDASGLNLRYRTVFNAMTDSIKSLSEPPEGYSRLFRVGEIRTNMADFLARTEQRSREIDGKSKQLQGVVNTSPFDAQGRWFTDDSNELDYYIKRYYSENFDVPNLPLPKIYYVDIPNKKLSDINVKNTKFRNSSLNPDKEFVVPDEFLSASKEVPLQFRNKGGMIYASKGTLVNYQPRGTDTVPAMLTPGEFVVNAKATKQNLGLLHSINNGSKGFSRGGVAYLSDGGMPNVNDITSIFDTLSNTGYPDDIIEKMTARSVEFKEKQAQKQKENQKRKEQEAKDLEEGKRKNKERSSQRKTNEGKRLEQVKRRQEYINKITDAQNTFLLTSMAREKDALQTTGLPLSELLAVNPILAAERQFRSKKGKTSMIAGDLITTFQTNIQRLGAAVRTPLENMYDIPFPSVEMFNKGGMVYASKGQKISSSIDTIPAMLTPGEFVVNKNATSNNLPLLQSLNKGGSVRYYQYGGAVDAGNTGASKGSSGPINGYNLTIDSETQNALSLFNKDFGSYVDKLINFSFPSIPDKIEMVGNHTVDVRISGAAAFEAIETRVKELITSSVDSKMGEIWSQTGGKIGKAPSLPSKK